MTPDEATAMRRAIAISAQGVGRSSPNPPVGCVILASDGSPAGEGYHLRKGQPHAEVHALQAAGDRAEGGIAVVTLEPCNHYGRTPPCTEALLDAKIRRVVVSLLDPTSRGAGGVTVLRSAGADVEVGALAEETLAVLGAWRASLDSGPRVTAVYATDSAGRRTRIAPGTDAFADAATVWRRADVHVAPDLTCSEGVAGSHDWALDKVGASTATALLDQLAALGARTVAAEADAETAASFLSDDRTEHVIAYLPPSPPSATPPGQLGVLPPGFAIASVRVLPDGWVRVAGQQSRKAEGSN